MSSRHYRNGQRVSESWDTVFRALSTEPRRQLIATLADAAPTDSVPLPESAMMPNAPVSPDELEVELYHQHLPLLAEMGFVQWTKEPFVATRGPRFQEIASVITTLQSQADRLPDALVVGCQRLEQELEEAR